MAYPTLYDAAIKAAMSAHFPQVDWRYGKAQLIAESNLDPNARSPVGAMGIAQFMPDTWDDMREAFDWPAEASPLDPQVAIPAFAHYMRRQWDAWHTPRPANDRLKLAQASYNAGLGNIIRAQIEARRGGKTVNDYDSIIAALPTVTGAQNAAETTGYVRRIGSIYAALVDPSA